MSGKKWKGKLLLLICLTAWLLFLLIQDRTHDAEKPPSGNGEELILPEPGVPEQEETLSKIPSADACIRVLILNKSGGIYHETKEPDRKYPGTLQDYETENAGSSSMRFRWKNIFGELYQARCHPVMRKRH